MLSESKPNGVARICLTVSGAILAISGLFKLISAVGSAKILLQADVIFGVPNRDLFFGVGVLEIVVVWMLCRPGSLRWKLILVAALSTNFLIYRAGLWWLGVRKPCPCLGNAAAWTHMDPEQLDRIMRLALAWLLGSSYGLLALFSWWGKQEGILRPLEQEV